MDVVDPALPRTGMGSILLILGRSKLFDRRGEDLWNCVAAEKSVSFDSILIGAPRVSVIYVYLEPMAVVSITSSVR